MMWPTTRISDFGTVITGKTPSSKNPEHFGELHPFITPTDMDEGRKVRTERHISADGFNQFRRKILVENSVCFVCIGATIGKICMTSEFSLTNQQINSIVVDTSKHDPFFVYYLLSTYPQKVKSIAGGAATPIVNKTAFESIKVPRPPLPIQRKIASILSAYDDLIENNLRRIKILEEMAQALYREWFVKFRFPGHEKVRMVDSPVGKIPEGWEVAKLRDLVETQYGYTESAQESPVGPKFLRGMDINKHSYINWDTVPYCPISEEKHLKFRLSKGDIIVIRMADPGKVGIVEQTVDAVFASYLVRLRTTSLQISPYYLFYFLLSDKYQGYITGASTGTTRKSASAGVITGTDLLIPNLKILKLFDDNILSIRKLIGNLLRRNTNLRQTRDLLLPRLISGELDVSDLEINIHEEAA